MLTGRKWAGPRLRIDAAAMQDDGKRGVEASNARKQLCMQTIRVALKSSGWFRRGEDSLRSKRAV